MHKALPAIALTFPMMAFGQMEPHMEGMDHGGSMPSMPTGADGRGASGTAWQPASSPIYAHHFQGGGWDVMAHYNLFLIHTDQGGPRGESQSSVINWGMAMAERPLGAGTIALRGMLSLEPLSTAEDGYPLLFQTGETWQDEPLVDRQHPHDFFMELSARYDRSLTGEMKGFLYLAPAGEPALGPVAYPHRLSAWNNPLSPLGHHWQDSSHITFGVVTAGTYTERWQTEASTFTGREPDEERWDIDSILLDSYSGRLTFNPDRNWSLSASYGFLNSPEALHPEENLHRTVLSAMFTLPKGDDLLAATAVWGRNDHDDSGTDSYLMEASYAIARRHTYFARLEHVTKRGEELAAEPADDNFAISSATLGYVHDVHLRSIDIGFGAGVSAYRFPETLDTVYGDDPRSYVLFVRIRPSQMKME